MRRKLSVFLAFVMVFAVACSSLSASAHSGRTDSSGGHRDNKNKSGLGSYHYHCGGHPAHLHSNGVCPYNTASTKPQTPAKPHTPTKPQTSTKPLTSIKPQPKVSVIVNGEAVPFDTPPVMVNDRVMIPMRTILERIGVTVLWDQESSASVGITKQNSVCIYDKGLLSNGAPSGYQVFINGELQSGDVLPQNIGNRLFVPLRTVAQAFGAQVNWDGVTQTVTITSNISLSDRLSAYEVSSIESFTSSKAKEFLHLRGYTIVQDELNFIYIDGQKYWKFIVSSNETPNTQVQIMVSCYGTIVEIPLY